MSISPISVIWMLWGLKVRDRPSLAYFPILGPKLNRTPNVKAPATPCTTPEAIESWKPKRRVIQPPALQPQAASRIHTAEPSSTARMRYAERRTRSSNAPDMIEAVVQLKSRNARKKTRLMLLGKFGPKMSDHGMPPWQTALVKSELLGPIGGSPLWVELLIHP